MVIHDVIQGTEEWLMLRDSHFTASEAPIMLGVSKYKSRQDLIRSKALGLSDDIDACKQALFDRGHAAEASALTIAEKIIGDDLFPATVTDEIDGLPLLASLDGMTMAGDIIWEHKLYSKSLTDQINAGKVEPHYTAQLDQQLLVTGAKKALFMCSDGTENHCVWMWYQMPEGAQLSIVNGWKQFEKDLANYQHIESTPTPEGKSPELLPALRIKLTGMVTDSNLAQFKETAMAVIGSVNTNLQTDSDFADAEKAVKWCKDVETRLESAKEHALSQTASINELFRALDSIKEDARIKRLELEKLVKSRKESLRAEILREGQDALKAHIDALNDRLGAPYMPAIQGDFSGAMKNKRTVSSLREAVSTELAKCKIAANEFADLIDKNLKGLRELASDYKFLFSDVKQIITKQHDDLIALIKTRIAEHKEAEGKRLEAERAKIRQEEEERVVKAAIKQRDAENHLRGGSAEASITEPRATATFISPAESPSSIKSVGKARPSDMEMIEVLALHYRVHELKIIEWLMDADLHAESEKLAASM